MYSKLFFRGVLLLAIPLHSLAHILHEQLAGVPHGWSVKGTPSDDTKITLEVALVQNNITDMVNALMAVSNPKSSSYGKYWSKAAVDSLLTPSQGGVDATTSWLQSSEVESYSQDGAYIAFRTTVGKANKMLNTKFAYYEKDGVTKLRTTKYSVGKHVSEHIDFIHPTTFFGNAINHAVPPPPPTTTDKKAVTKRASVPAACLTGLTPACVKNLYNIPLDYVPDITSGASIAYGSFLNQSSAPSDLFLFEQTYNISMQNFSTIVFQNGLNDQNASTAQDGEANLDVQNIIGVSHPIPVTQYITGGLAPIIPDLLEPTIADASNEPYLQYYRALLAMSDQMLPQVITNSYGDDEQSVPPKYAANVCNLIGMMGLRGVTILESSGDSGVGAACISNTGRKRKLTFNPIFPATCPYLTSVGGTQGIPEIAWIGSSGGFSSYFARPYYQQTALNTYINKYIDPSTALYLSQFANFSGRGFPDVAAMSVEPYYYGFYDGKRYRNGGTSAASPVWAGIVGLLNSARLKAGLPTMGFMNPWLYSTGYQYLNDITAGNSIGCNGNNTQTDAPVPGAPTIPYAQWNATPGWDPTTGWGVPDFQAMLAAALAM